MFKFKQAFFIFISLLLFTNISSQIREYILTGSTSFVFENQSHSNIILLNCQGSFEQYIRIKLERSINNNFKYHMIASDTEDINSPDNSVVLRSETNDHVLYAPTSQFKSSKRLYIYLNIFTEEGNVGSYTLNLTYTNYIDLTLDKSYLFPHYFNEGEQHFRLQMPQEKNDIYLYVLEPTMEECTLSVKEIVFYEKFGKILLDYEIIENAFYGGKLIKIPKKSLHSTPFDPENFIEIIFEEEYYTDINNFSFTVGIDLLDSFNDIIDIGYSKYGHVDSSSSFGSKRCYDVSIKNGELFNSAITTTSGVNVFLSNNKKAGNKVKETKVLTSGHLSFTKSEIEANKYICFVPLNGNDIAYYQIQIIDATDLSVGKLLYDPLVGGVPYNIELQPNGYQVFLYNIIGYSRIDYRIHEITEEVGKIEAFRFTTKKNQLINFTKASLNATKDVELVNQNGILFDYLLSEFNKFEIEDDEYELLAVYCKPENTQPCVFDVDTFESYEYTLLKENKPKMTLRIEESIFMYKLNIADKTIHTIYLEMSFINLIENNFSIKKDGQDITTQFKKMYFENKIVYVITKEQMNNNLIGIYTITDDIENGLSLNKLNYYVERDNEENKEIEIHNGFQETYYLNVNEKTFYNVKNVFSLSDEPFMTLFQPVNCQIKVFFINNGTEEELLFNNENYIQHIISSAKDNYYKYSVQAVSLAYNNPNMCSVRISTTSLDKNAKLILGGGVPLNLKFNKQFREINLGYISKNMLQSDLFFAHVQTNSDTILELSGSDSYRGMFQESYKIFHQNVVPLGFIHEAQEIPTNWYVVNNFTLSVFSDSLFNKNLENDVEVEIKIHDYLPLTSIYLHKSMLKIDSGGIEKESVFYYTELNENEEGYVNIHFERGYGKLAGIIINKDQLNISNYEELKDIDVEPFYVLNGNTHANEKLYYSKIQTKKCKEGCFLVLTAKYSGLTEELQTDKIQFYITPVVSDPTPIEIPLNEFIYGSIMNTSLNDYFTVKVPKEYKQIEIQFQSDICQMYINEGTVKPSENNKIALIDSKTQISLYTINTNEVEKRYTFAISCKEFSHINNSPYKFRVRSIHKEIEELIEVHSSNELKCTSKEDKSFCDFLIMNDYLNKGTENFIYIKTDNPASPITIYARQINDEEYLKLSSEQKKEMLPRPSKQGVINSHSQFNTNYLHLTDLTSTDWILVSVYSEQKATISFFDSYKDTKRNLFINYYTPILVFIEDNNADIIITEGMNGYVTIEGIQSQGELVYNSDYYIGDIKKGSQIHFNYTYSDDYYSRKEYSLNYNSGNEEPIIFLAWFTNQQPTTIIGEIEFTKSGVTYLQSNEFPIIQYAKIYSSDDIFYNFNLYSNEIGDFVIEGYVVDVEFISKIKVDNTIKPSSQKINGSYDKYSKMGYIYFPSEDIQINSQTQNYLLIIISKSINNKHEYEDFHFGHSLIYASNPNVPISKDFYYNGLVLPKLKANIYSLSKLVYENTHMMIELFLSNKNINFAISDDSSFNSLVNKTNIIVGQISSSEGHSIIIVDLQQVAGDSVYIAFFSTERTTIDLHFTLRYSDTLPQIDVGTMNITTDNKSFEFTINPFYSELWEIYSTEYVIRFYDKNLIQLSNTILTPFSSFTPQLTENRVTSNTYLQELILTKLHYGTYQILVTAIIKDSLGIPIMIETFPIQEYIIQNELDEFIYNDVNIRNYNTFLSDGYIKLLDDKETQTTLNIKLTNFTYNKRNTLKDLFTVKAYYVDELFINNKKVDHSLQPTTSAFTSKQYLIDNTLLVEMTNQDNLNNYIYFVINPDENNINNYANYTIEVIAHSPLKVPTFVTPQNHNYIGKLKSNVNTNYYLLNRESEDIKYIMLYFSNKINNKPITFSIESYTLNTIPTKQNSSDITFTTSETFNGIKYVKVELPSDKTHFMVSVYSEDNDEIEYSFKWNSFSTDSQSIGFNYDLSIIDFGVFLDIFVGSDTFDTNHYFEHLDYIIKIYLKKDLDAINEFETAFNEYEGDNSTISPIFETITTLNLSTRNIQMKLDISLEEDYIVKIIEYGTDKLTGEEIKQSGYINMEASGSDIKASFNELFSIKKDDIIKLRFMKLPDDINDFTFLIKSETYLPARVGIVDEEAIHRIIEGSFYNPNSIRIYNSPEYAGVINLHRDDPSKKYFCITADSYSYSYSDASFILTAYTGKVNDYILPQKQYFIDSLDSQKDMYKIYKLQKENENENVIEIEFAFNYDNYIYSIEDYIEGKDPTFTTNSNKILKKEEKHGKVRIVYDVTNINTILLSFKPTTNTRNFQNISYQLKYKSYVSINDYVEYPDKLDVKLNIADHNKYVVELQNPFYGHQMNNFSIHYTIYKKSPLTGTLTSMYMPNEYEREDDKEIYEYYVKAGTFEKAQNEHYNNITISYLDDDYNISKPFPEEGMDYYFKGVIYGVDSNGEEFKIAYNLLEVSQRSRNVIDMEFGTEMINSEGAYVFSGQEHLFISQITKQPYVDFSKHPITAHWTCTIYTGNMDNSTDYRENDIPLIVEGYIVSQETINELLKYDVSEIPGKQAIEVFHFNETDNIDINFPIPEDPNIESQYVLIRIHNQKYTELHMICSSLKIFPNIQPTIDYRCYSGTFTLNKYKNSISFSCKCNQENGPYIEFVERYNNKDLDIAIETNNTLATFQNNTNIIYNNVKGGKRVIKAECPKEGTIMFSFINKGQDDLALSFINHDSTIRNNYLKYNDYNSQLNINPDYNNGKITLTFHNVYSILNQLDLSYGELERQMTYVVSLYQSDDVLSNSNKYDSLFPFDNDDKYIIQPDFEKQLIVEPSLNTITTTLSVAKNKLYYVKVKFQYNDFNFGYDLTLLNTTTTYFYEINPNQLESYCIEQGFSSLALYMPINENDKLPSFTIRYSNVQSNKENAINSIKINGYTVNEAFISNKKIDYSVLATEPSAEANYLYSEKAAFLSLNNLNMNQYAYMELSSGTKEIDSICFDVYPFYPGNVPNYSLIQNKFMYHIMQTATATMSYKLTAGNRNDKYYVIEIIKSKNANINFIVETYKESPSYTNDVNITSSEDKEKIIFTINTDNIVQSDKSLLVHAMIKEQSSKMIQRNLQEVNTNDNYFFIKYTTHSNTPKQLEYNKTIIVSRNNTGIDISFENVMYKYPYDLSSVIYNINVYSDTNIKDVNDINTYIMQSNVVPIVSKEINANPNNEKINEYYEVADTYSGNNLYLRVSAEVIINEKEEQKLLYEITTVSVPKPDPVPDNEGGSGAILWIIIAVVLVIALVVIGFVIKAKRKSAGSNLDTSKYKKDISLIDNEKLL